MVEERAEIVREGEALGPGGGIISVRGEGPVEVAAVSGFVRSGDVDVSEVVDELTGIEIGGLTRFEAGEGAAPFKRARSWSPVVQTPTTTFVVGDATALTYAAPAFVGCTFIECAFVDCAFIGAPLIPGALCVELTAVKQASPVASKPKRH